MTNPVTNPVNNPTIRVYLVEDQVLLKESLRAMLELEDDIEVVGEAVSAEIALPALATLPVDVVLMDIRLPGMNGILATQQFKEQNETAQVVMLTTYDNEYLEDSFEAGARGYVSKSCTRQQLAQAVRDVWQGRVYVDPSLGGGLVQELSNLRRANRNSLLTTRQSEILKMVANGFRYKDIASALFITERTVNREIRKIFDSLEVNEAPHAVSEALKRGLI